MPMAVRCAPGHGMGAKAQELNLLADGLNFFRRRLRFHDHEHGVNDLSLHSKCTGLSELRQTSDIPEQMDHPPRLRRLRRQMKQQGIESLLVTHLPDVRYLCGFTGSNAFLAITANRAAMFTDGRYIAQARQETSAARVVIAAKSARDEACQWLASPAAQALRLRPGIDHGCRAGALPQSSALRAPRILPAPGCILWSATCA